MLLEGLAKLVRHHILTSTTEAGSGHPTSSLSATDLMTVLYFKHLRYDCGRPEHPNNDRVIFSKGHAAPLFYSLYAAAGELDAADLKQLRRLGSPLQGHPTPQFRHSEAATGSLGQGLSIGVGMALNAKYLDHLPGRVYVLLGDGEMAEGSVWEAIQLAAHYKLDNLVAIVDVNRMGQSQETMYGHDVGAYADRISAFGWDTVVVDGHSIGEIEKAFAWVVGEASDPALPGASAGVRGPSEALPESMKTRVASDNAGRGPRSNGRPKAIVAKTLKGKGVSFIEDKPGWHGKVLSVSDLEKALKELGPVDMNLRGEIRKPEDLKPKVTPPVASPPPPYKKGDQVATRKAYGNALARLVGQNPSLISIDAETKNSTFAEILMQKKQENYFEMFIAEQNMIGVAVGLARRGKIPFASSFAAFLTRAFDQIRMAAVSEANIKCVGSHVGVSIGEDGPSQMGLEDIAMFRAVHGSTVLYPSDAVSTEYLVEESIKTPGVLYLRTSRPATPVLYDVGEKFPIGGSKVLKSSAKDAVTVVAAGVTLFESLEAYERLAKEGISIRVVDLYSVKPIDAKTLLKAARETKAIVVVEDHWWDGGIGDAVLNVFSEKPAVPVYKMAVRNLPGSGKPAELIEQAGISANAIVKKVKEILV